MGVVKDEILNLLALLEGVAAAGAIGFGWHWLLVDFTLRNMMIGQPLYVLCVILTAVGYIKWRLG